MNRTRAPKSKLHFLRLLIDPWGFSTPPRALGALNMLINLPGLSPPPPMAATTYVDYRERFQAPPTPRVGSARQFTTQSPLTQELLTTTPEFAKIQTTSRGIPRPVKLLPSPERNRYTAAAACCQIDSHQNSRRPGLPERRLRTGHRSAFRPVTTTMIYTYATCQHIGPPLA